jgi:drug/metabolite transporter (DMT)-like permease
MPLVDSASRDDRARGIVQGLLAAAFFGLSAPLGKRLLENTGPVLLAGLLYLAGGVSLTAVAWMRRARGLSSVEARLRRADVPYLAGIILLGGMAGPIFMLLGLQRISGFVGSLLLNLEAPLTMLIAVVFFREHLSRRETVAALCIVLGAAAFRIDPGQGRIDGIGIVLLAAACLCWAIDNNLTQKLSVRDPLAIARVKTLSAGTTNVVLGLVLGERMTSLSGVPAIVLVGALGYGASIVLDNLALRRLGAAREAAIFATAPFVGAAAAIALFREWPRIADMIGAALMLIGVVVLIRARHSHRHTHEPLAHEHAHTHDEHHHHAHDPNDPLGEPHVHAHRHDPVEHEHEHVSDVHHRHDH